MMVSPAKTRLRRTVRSCGFTKSFTPISRQNSRDQRQAVDHEAALAVGLDDDLELAAVGQQADARAVALGQADLVEQARGLGRDRKSAFSVRSIGWNSGLSRHDGVVALDAEAEQQRVVEGLAVDAERQRAAEAHVAVERAPDRDRSALRLG